MSAIKTEQEQVKQFAHAEATRYMNNATETLQKAGKEDYQYLDDKYVRTACGIAHLGVLKALDAYFELRGVPLPPKKKHKNIEFYTYHAARLDGKLSKDLHDAYRILHIEGYYEGVCEVATIKSGFDIACRIIARIKPERELTQEEYKALKARKKPAWLRALYSLYSLFFV
ncbi:MAG: DUF5618 family protein [Prevotellaceae bacterium]|jgi:hypothetical protein|nr:DUF5618 family protein [Prevotellaceae bacterium]